MGFKTFSVKKKKRTEVDCSLKTLHRLVKSQWLTTTASRHDWFMTVPRCFDVHWNTHRLNWRNCSLYIFKCSLKIVLRYQTYRSNSKDLLLIPFVTLWKLIRCHAVTPGWLDYAARLLAPWQTISSLAHEITAADAGRFESCISRKLFGG